MACLLGHGRNRYGLLIGGGGKTTAMFALAKAISHVGHTVITTTSTRILRPPPEVSPVVIINRNVSALLPAVADRLAVTPHVTVARSLLPDGAKLSGFPADDLDRLRDTGIADYILVEADGADGRSVKAHADHEPVVSHRADLVIVVIGIDCIGKPLNDEHVHRAERFSHLIGLARNAKLTVRDIATLFFHPRGYLKTVEPRSEVCVFLSKARSSADRDKAGKLADALLAADAAGRISQIAIGDLRGNDGESRSYAL